MKHFSSILLKKNFIIEIENVPRFQMCSSQGQAEPTKSAMQSKYYEDGDILTCSGSNPITAAGNLWPTFDESYFESALILTSYDLIKFSIMLSKYGNMTVSQNCGGVGHLPPNLKFSTLQSLDSKL